MASPVFHSAQIELLIVATPLQGEIVRIQDVAMETHD
jgi:hypothetical protein